LKLDTTQLHISIVDETQVGYQASTLVICLVMTFTSSSHYLTLLERIVKNIHRNVHLSFFNKLVLVKQKAMGRGQITFQTLLGLFHHL